MSPLVFDQHLILLSLHNLLPCAKLFGSSGQSSEDLYICGMMACLVVGMGPYGVWDGAFGILYLVFGNWVCWFFSFSV